jgi:hypothetical protein
MMGSVTRSGTLPETVTDISTMVFVILFWLTLSGTGTCDGVRFSAIPELFSLQNGPVFDDGRNERNGRIWRDGHGGIRRIRVSRMSLIKR